MDKINIQNGVTKVNADTFNTLQNNIESAINDISSTTVIDNLTSTSATDALSANQGKILKDKIKGTVLYEDSTGTTSDITLSETAANFKKLEVQYNYSGICSSNTIENPNGKKMSLSVGFSVIQYNVARYQYRVISISETSITTDTAGYLSCSEAGTSGVSSTENKIYITKVIGYKET